jgi:hypothetical protein
LKLHRLAAALAAAFPLLAAAADAADPVAPVPPPAYRSVLPATAADLAEEAIPWRKANADVARFPRGHADLLKWEAAQERQVPSPATGTPAQEKPHGTHH